MTDHREMLANTLEMARWNEKSLRARLSDAIEFLEYAVRDAREAASGPDSNFNGLGVVQGRGLEVDRHIVQLKAMREEIVRLEYLLTAYDQHQAEIEKSKSLAQEAYDRLQDEKEQAEDIERKLMR
jgi:hypothetical protein